MKDDGTVDIQKELFGSVEGQPVFLYTLRAGHITLRVMNYGATITGIELPDRKSELHNVVAGFSTLDEYLKPHPYLGAVVGRFANRIAGGKFTLDGKAYQLTINDGTNHLHGGVQGFDKKVWQPEHTVIDDENCSIVFSTTSADGEEGYPGNLKVKVLYSVNTQNEVGITLRAKTDKATPLSLTNHSYFNLSGFQKSTILDHELALNSSFYTEKNENNTSTGKLLKCAGTPQDFKQAKKIRTDIHMLIRDRGYDHNHVIDGVGYDVRPVARLSDSFSGRIMEVESDMPGVQLYTANWWDGSLTGSQGVPYVKHGAIALETQQFPDSPNHPEFPNCILRPGEDFSSKTIYKFSTLGN